MRLASFARGLKETEMQLARKVFHKALPSLGKIGITNGLGKGDTIWTRTRNLIPGSGWGLGSFEYYIAFGDAVNADLSTSGVTLDTYVPGYPDMMANVFIHELTHVWQYSRMWSVDVAARCVYAQEIGAGYTYKAGAPWGEYNLEQQASIVEDWSKRGRKEDDELFPYIHYIVRNEGPYGRDISPTDFSRAGELYSPAWFQLVAKLEQLKFLLDMERQPATPDHGPVRETTKDDSLVAVLDDVVFATGKAELKPAADLALEQAWAKIKASPRRRYVLINGHTDSVGGVTYNVGLSEDRAKAVAEWFYRRKYLTPAAVRTQGFGKAQPTTSNATSGGRAKNRRVEIYVVNN